MRFQYDPVTDCSVKSNDRFEFFEKINLNEFLKDSEPSDKGPASYTLHAVCINFLITFLGFLFKNVKLTKLNQVD